MGGAGLTGEGSSTCNFQPTLTAFYGGFSDNFGLTVADAGFFYCDGLYCDGLYCDGMRG